MDYPALAAYLTLNIAAVLLLWAGTRLALSKPPPESAFSRRRDPESTRATVSRAMVIVGGATLSLAVLSLAGGVYLQHVSLTAVIFMVAAVAGGLQLTRYYVPPRWRAAVSAALALCALAWLTWPGWATADLLAAVIAVQIIAVGQFAWSFRTLAVTGLAVAGCYDAVQVWVTHGIVKTAQPHGAGINAWLPLLLYAPARTGWHAPLAAVLGVGDIVIPGLLIVAAGRAAQVTGRPGLYRAAVAAFAAGLAVVTTVLLLDGGAAFPVTVVTIPAVVAAVYLVASRTGTRPALAVETARPGPPEYEHPRTPGGPAGAESPTEEQENR